MTRLLVALGAMMLSGCDDLGRSAERCTTMCGGPGRVLKLSDEGCFCHPEPLDIVAASQECVRVCGPMPGSWVIEGRDRLACTCHRPEPLGVFTIPPPKPIPSRRIARADESSSSAFK